MPKKKIDEKLLMKMIKDGMHVDEIAANLGIKNMNYARTKVKEAYAKLNIPDYPGLFPGKGSGGGGGMRMRIQPKITAKKAINLTNPILSSWGIHLYNETEVTMSVNRPKNKITLSLNDEKVEKAAADKIKKQVEELKAAEETKK
jgi:hypothetical protein